MNQFTASLWGDEAWAATLAVKSIPDIIRLVSHDTSPPLYYLLLHLWLQIFGTSEVAIRSLSFLFFLATILTVYLLGKHFWDKKTGLWAAFLTFVNPFLFIYAFEGRMYALLLFTSTLSVYFFLKKNRLGFILATAAALYTHHFALFIVFFEFLWASWENQHKKLLRGLTDFFIIGLLYLPWLYPLYYQTTLVGSGFWLAKPNLTTFKETVRQFLVGSGNEVARQVAYWTIIITLALRKWLKDTKKTFFLLGWFFIPLILTFIVSQFFQSIFYDRYLLLVIPAGSLLIASLRRKISLIFTIIVIFSLLTLNFYYFFHPTKKPFRELAQFVKQEAKNLPLINYNAAAHHLWETKYYGLPAPIYSPQPLPFYTGTALMEKGDVVQSLPKEKKIGVITSAPVAEVKIPGYHIIKSKQFGQLLFLWMEKN